MSLWRKVLSGLVTLGGALIALLLAARRNSTAPPPTPDTKSEEQLEDLEVKRQTANQAVLTEQARQAELARSATDIGAQLAQVDKKVEALSHDELAAQLRRALDSAPDATPAPAAVVVKPSSTIKPAS